MQNYGRNFFVKSARSRRFNGERAIRSVHDTKAVSDAKEKVKHNERQKQTSHLQRDESERKNERGEGGEGEREEKIPIK